MYIVSFVSIFFNLQICFILQLENKSRKAKNANKITTNKKEVEKAKKIEIEIKETKVETKTTKIDIETNAKTSATIVAIITTTTTNRKRLLKLRKQFVCIYISLAFKIVLILLSCLLLFNNL